VYYLFVAPFDLSDHSVIVRRKDNNKLNCHYLNLRLVYISEVAKQGFLNNIRKSKFQENIKPVSQYSLQGKCIKIFPSAKVAGEALSVPSTYINDAARTKIRHTADAYWPYGKATARINVLKIRNRLESTLRRKKRKV
jgi:hypothetical protein